MRATAAAATEDAEKEPVSSAALTVFSAVSREMKRALAAAAIAETVPAAAATATAIKLS